MKYSASHMTDVLATNIKAVLWIMGVTEKGREGERPCVTSAFPSLVSCELNTYVCES